MVSLHVSNTAISGLRPKALGAAAGEHHDECQGADAPALWTHLQPAPEPCGRWEWEIGIHMFYRCGTDNMVNNKYNIQPIDFPMFSNQYNDGKKWVTTIY